LRRYPERFLTQIHADFKTTIYADFLVGQRSNLYESALNQRNLRQKENDNMTTNLHLGDKTSSAKRDAPLAHAHVLITRPVMPASRTAQRLAALGATPYVFPTTIIEAPSDRRPLKDALSNLSSYHAVIFVSPSAAEMTISPLGAPPIKLPDSLLVFAPGHGTAEELQLRGVEDVGIPTTSFDSEGLLALPALQAKLVKGKRIAIFRGNDGREVLREELVKRGATVDAITAYHRRAPAVLPTGLIELIREKKLTAISAMSSDSVTNLVAILPKAEQIVLFALPLYASHERIAETATKTGFRNVIATQAGDAGLITALLSDRNPSPPQPSP
jgi:uroporphyrinogen-III synthase